MVDANVLIKLLESSYDGIWITDHVGKILFANSANAKLLGVPRSELENKTTQELQDEGVFQTSAILEALQTRQQVSRVCNNPRTCLTVLATATPVFNEAGDIQYIFNNVRDITALNEMRESLQDKDEIIRQQNSQLETMKLRLGVGTIVANSKAFTQVVELARRAATFDGATVLILGESGTGKEVISELIVNTSPRKDKPYLQINCGAIPENLIESELFGYEKGAFTGADAKGRKGLFEAANGGTVFLDEIGDLPLHMQVKLLRVLQQRRIVRVGGTETVNLDVRIIAATNKDLKQMVNEGRFREDLYYRLNVVPIEIPPLRDRKEDILPLVNHFLTVANRKYHTNKSIYSDTIDVLESYSWPGNVRELENLMENLVITTPGDIIRRENLSERLKFSTENRGFTEDTEVITLKETVERAEYMAIQKAIRQCGSIRKAAVALGVDPSTIVRKQQNYQK
jgi:PAS domain S-box-containing protein